MGYAPRTRLVLWGEDAQIRIGNRCHLNGVSICARKSVSIGDDCIFAGGVQIIDSNSHKICASPRTYVKDAPVPVTIGNNVWVGLNAIILKGSQIGDNCVIGAGSVVKGIFPPNSVVSGNPAKVVKTFEISTVDKKS